VPTASEPSGASESARAYRERDSARGSRIERALSSLPPLYQRVTLVSAAGVDQTTQNLRVRAAVAICSDAGTRHNFNHPVELLGGLGLPSNNAVFGG
jgi:hypothetical protein